MESFMMAIKGLTTMIIVFNPSVLMISNTNGRHWYHKDLPNPVGRITNTSCPEIKLTTAVICSFFGLYPSFPSAFSTTPLCDKRPLRVKPINLI